MLAADSRAQTDDWPATEYAVTLYYEHLGYTVVKTQNAFRKTLA